MAYVFEKSILLSERDFLETEIYSSLQKRQQFLLTFLKILARAFFGFLQFSGSIYSQIQTEWRAVKEPYSTLLPVLTIALFEQGVERMHVRCQLDATTVPNWS